MKEREPTISDRGFAQWPAIEHEHGSIQIRESSLAAEPCLWLSVDGHDVHLSTLEAVELLLQLKAWHKRRGSEIAERAAEEYVADLAEHLGLPAPGEPRTTEEVDHASE